MRPVTSSVRTPSVRSIAMAFSTGAEGHPPNVSMPSRSIATARNHRTIASMLAVCIGADRGCPPPAVGSLFPPGLRRCAPSCAADRGERPTRPGLGFPVQAFADEEQDADRGEFSRLSGACSGCRSTVEELTCGPAPSAPDGSQWAAKPVPEEGSRR